jgi:hypothetical protein
MTSLALPVLHVPEVDLMGYEHGGAIQFAAVDFRANCA